MRRQIGCVQFKARNNKRRLTLYLTYFLEQSSLPCKRADSGIVCAQCRSRFNSNRLIQVIFFAVPIGNTSKHLTHTQRIARTKVHISLFLKMLKIKISCQFLIHLKDAIIEMSRLKFLDLYTCWGHYDWDIFYMMDYFIYFIIRQYIRRRWVRTILLPGG